MFDISFDLFESTHLILRSMPEIFEKEKIHKAICTKPFAQRYKVKHILRQNSTMSINLFRFSIFYVVFVFLTHKKEKID